MSVRSPCEHGRVRLQAYAPHHCIGIARLCGELGWPSYSDLDVADRGCSAPGVAVRVAVADDGQVLGFAQVMGDGVVQSFLAQLAVTASHRRQALARALVEAAFTATGTERMDLLTDNAKAFIDHSRIRRSPAFGSIPASPDIGMGVRPRAAEWCGPLLLPFGSRAPP